MRGGGQQKIAEQHAREKLTARERLALLIDEGTFVELGIHGRPHFSQRAMDGKEAPADGVLTAKRQELIESFRQIETEDFMAIRDSIRAEVGDGSASRTTSTCPTGRWPAPTAS